MRQTRLSILIIFLIIAFFVMNCSSGKEGRSYTEKDKDIIMSAENSLAPPAARGQKGVMYFADEASDFSGNFNTEEYDYISENKFKSVLSEPLSTFSIDVDTASYSNIRRFLQHGQMPPVDSVRIEEMINYFDYDYPQPDGDNPFSVNLEISDCLWNADAKLLSVGLQGKSLDYENLKPANLTFLVDSSGSMSDENKLPLLKKALALLLGELSAKDRVAIVAYAGSSGLVLDSTEASEKKTIINALDSLSAGGGTAGAAGIELAYEVAMQNYIPGGNNRVILCTDGDFNLGVSSTSDLVRLIEEKRKSDIYLTICGFGMGNYKDGRMEQISAAGNGNYFYIDGMAEAEKVFVREMRANMFTIAKDVKIQIEFNPALIKAYRLVGYENRLLDNEDFEDDTKDAGELGAGHRVTALYELVPAGPDIEIAQHSDLKYSEEIRPNNEFTSEALTVKLRYKRPDSEISELIEKSLEYAPVLFDKASANIKFASAVAGFGMLLRNSEYIVSLDYGKVLDAARSAVLRGNEAYGRGFAELVEIAGEISDR